jgi:outer membrane protein TolC
VKSLKTPTGRRGLFVSALLGAAVSQMSCAAVDTQPPETAASRRPARAATAAPETDQVAADAPRAGGVKSPLQPSSVEVLDGPENRAASKTVNSSADAQPARPLARSATSRKAKKAAPAAPGDANGVVRQASGSGPIGDDQAENAAPGRDADPAKPDSESEVDGGRQTVPPGGSAEADSKVAPLEAADKTLPINLASALRLADARPLVVAAAQASAWVAEAQLQRAQLIWVPTLNLASDYIRHDGYGPDFNRGVNTSARPLNQNVNYLYSGAGLTMGFALTDAIYEPLAAKQVLKSKRFDIQAAKNDALLTTARAYFDVHQYRGQYAGAVDVVNRGEKLLDRITHLSEDLVPKVEADRAKRMLATAQQNAAMARQQWRVSSANLTQALRLDPRVVVDPAEPDHLQMTLIEPSRPLDDLIPTGLTNRPELASQQAMVGAVAERIRREKGRILMPSIFLNGFQTPNELIEVGAQGIGFDRNLNLWSVRDDFSPQVAWQFEGMGFGNLARIKEQRGEQSRAMVELFKVQDGVAADVTRAQARVQAAAVRIVEAERALREAIITYDGNYEGLRQTKRFDNILIQVYRPQEAVVALNDLLVSYNQYFATVADYNRAQFEMYHALGYPAIDIADFHPPREVEPVDTSRPEYLPPVGEGPPPATR